MSRSSAATAAGRTRTIPRSPAPPLPRRVSGPAVANRRDASATAPLPRQYAAPRRRTFAPPRLAYGGVAIASRAVGVAVDVSRSRAMDRLVRGRAWIGVIAFGLIGIVAMQVSLLKLNSGIGRAVVTASTLERSNASLRGEVSRLSAGDRIQRTAEADGLVMPAPGDVTYLRAGDARGDAARAAQRMRAPTDPATAGLAGLPAAGAPVVAAPGSVAGDPAAPAAAAGGAVANTTGAPPATAVPQTATAPAANAIPATGTPATAIPATGGATGAPATGTAASSTTAPPAGAAASGGAQPPAATTTLP